MGLDAGPWTLFANELGLSCDRSGEAARPCQGIRQRITVRLPQVPLHQADGLADRSLMWSVGLNGQAA